jgi:hypothetical protein
MTTTPEDTRWFKAKEVGYGFVPASWRGWAATAVFVVLVVAAAAPLRLYYGPSTAFQAIAILVVGFLVLGHWTGAKGWWKRKTQRD